MFGNNLKLKRKEKGLSQEELASKLHVVRQTVSKWEKGVSVPDADLLVRISEVLDTPVATLIGGPIEASADVNVISQQLEQINATLAARNRRGRLIWRTILIVLAASLVIYIAIALVGSITYNSETHESISSVLVE